MASVLRCSPLNRALCLLVFQWLKASSVYVLCPFGSWSELSQQICIVGSISWISQPVKHANIRGLLHLQVVSVGFLFSWLKVALSAFAK